MDSLDGCTCKPSYFTLYRDPTGRQVRGDDGTGRIVGRTRRRRDAERWLERLQERIELGVAEPTRQKSITFPDWRTEYEGILAGRVKSRELAPSTEQGYHETLRLAADSLGHIELRQIGNREIAAFLDSLGDVAPATRARRLRELGACLAAARGRKYLEHDPVGEYRKTEGRGLKVPKRGTDPYTDAELSKLWTALRQDGRKAVDPVYVHLCRFAVATGARQGELLALDWDRIDLTAGTMVIDRTFDTHGMRPPKDKEARIVNLTPAAVKVLGEWIQHTGVKTTGPVFVGPHGERLNGDYTWRVLERARKNAGIPKLGQTGLKRTFHSFRDTFARQMLERGVNPEWVRRQLGHSGLTLTVEVYGEWTTEAMTAAAATVPANLPGLD
jgi:integrase